MASKVMQTFLFASLVMALLFARLILSEKTRDSEIAAILIPALAFGCVNICAALIWLTRFETEGWRRLSVIIYSGAFVACVLTFKPTWGWRDLNAQQFFFDFFLPTVGIMSAMPLAYLGVIRIGRWLIEGFTKESS